MGLLDEAIREHLELKRRRGGDPAEIERAEREALGPVRREPEPLEPSVLEADPSLADEELAYEPEPAAGAGYPSEAGDFESPVQRAWSSEDAPSTEEHHEPWTEPAPPAQSHEPAFPVSEPPAPSGDPFEDDLDHRTPPPHPATPPAAEEEHLGPETVEYHLDPERLEGQAPSRGIEGEAEHRGEDDMLEETPEFLQDTPDHDRLWFEQRPPRDFDFDN